MPVRPSLTRSIPFWILLAVSAVLTGVGAWLVLDRLTALDAMLRSTPADAAAQLNQTVAVYAGPPAVTAGAVLLGAGLIGLLLTLTVAAIRTILPAATRVGTVAVDDNDLADAPDAFPPVHPADVRTGSVSEPVATNAGGQTQPR